jgi:hypothetical protein
VCVGIETVVAFVGAIVAGGFVASLPLVVVGKITSWNTLNRVGIENVIPPPDDEPPELMFILTDPDVSDALPVVVPIVLVGIETCMTGVGAMGIPIIPIPDIADAMDSNRRSSSISTEIEACRRAVRAFITCRSCSWCDLMGLILCELS